MYIYTKNVSKKEKSSTLTVLFCLPNSTTYLLFFGSLLYFVYISVVINCNIVYISGWLNKKAYWSPLCFFTFACVSKFNLNVANRLIWQVATEDVFENANKLQNK
jgi:hypothetical protein